MILFGLNEDIIIGMKINDLIYGSFHHEFDTIVINVGTALIIKEV
jgi:hypothetical protein